DCVSVSWSVTDWPLSAESICLSRSARPASRGTTRRQLSMSLLSWMTSWARGARRWRSTPSGAGDWPAASISANRRFLRLCWGGRATQAKRAAMAPRTIRTRHWSFSIRIGHPLRRGRRLVVAVQRHFHLQAELAGLEVIGLGGAAVDHLDVGEETVAGQAP